jgi:hypothetical protein
VERVAPLTTHALQWRRRFIVRARRLIASISPSTSSQFKVNRMIRSFIALLVAACAVSPAAPRPLTSAQDIRWFRTFASEGDDWINDFVTLREGRLLAVGYLNRVELESDWRALAVELTANGAIRRQREYGEGGGVDSFWNAAEATDGSLAHVGFTTRIGAGGIDAYLVRTLRDGALISEHAFGEAHYDRFTDLAPAPGGGWIMVGHSVGPDGMHRRVFIVRANAAGEEVWRRIFTERESSGALYIEPTTGGAYIVSGGASQGDDSDLLLLKIDADGNELWRRVVGAPNSADVNHGLVVRPDGRIVAVGYTASWGAQSYDLFAMTFSAEGELIERSVFGGAEDDRPIGARQDANGQVWLAGYTRSAGTGDWDVIIAALDPSGRFLPGAAILSGSRDDNGTAVLPLPGGDLLVGGYSTSLSGRREDAFILRLKRPDLTQPHPLFTRR